MRGLREKFRRTTDSLYWRQFMLSAGMVLLMLLMVLLLFKDLFFFIFR